MGRSWGLFFLLLLSVSLSFLFVKGCISTFISKTDLKTNAHRLFLPARWYLEGKAPVFKHMTQQDKPYNKKQTMQGQPWASKPWSPFVQRFPWRLLEIPVNKAECRESTLLKQRAQHSGLLNHLSCSPGEKKFATESHKWTESACLEPSSLHVPASPAWHQLLARRQQRLRNEGEKRDVQVKLFLKLALALVCMISRSLLHTTFSLIMISWGLVFWGLGCFVAFFFQQSVIRRVNTVQKKTTPGVNYILHGVVIQYAVKFFHSGGNKGYLSINALSTIHTSTAYPPVDNAISATFQIKKHMLFFFPKQGSAAHLLHLTKNKSF